MTESEIRQNFNNNIRNKFLQSHPNCQYCGIAATQVHHIIPIALGGDNRLNNLISLCDKHHSLIHNFKKLNYKELQKVGIERAKKEGRYRGGHPKPKPDNWQELYQDYLNRKYTKVALAKKLNISRPTLDRWIKELENENSN